MFLRFHLVGGCWDGTRTVATLADEAVLNKVHTKIFKKSPFLAVLFKVEGEGFPFLVVPDPIFCVSCTFLCL
jgi:hypothetical protein